MLTAEEIARAATLAANQIEAHGWFRVSEGRAITSRTEGSRKCDCVLTALPVYGVDHIVRELSTWLGWTAELGMSHADFVTDWNDRQASADVVVKALREFATEMRKKDSLTNAA